MVCHCKIGDGIESARERLYVVFVKTGTCAVVLPVEGQGCSRWNSRVTSRDRCWLAEATFGKKMTPISTPEIINRRGLALIS
jgi:hypothetical protein